VTCPAPVLGIEVLLIGDSITEGFISGPEGLNRSCIEERCWAARLAARLGQGYRVIERGVGGATTLDWAGPAVGIPYADVEGSLVFLFEGLAAEDLAAEIAVILLGTNDATGFMEDAPIPPDEYGRKLALLTRRLLDRDIDHVVLVSPPAQRGAPAEVQNRLAAYGRAIERLCQPMSREPSGERPAVICGPDLLGLLGPEHFEENDIHPNASGHRRIAEAVAETIEALSRGRVPEPDQPRSSSPSSGSSAPIDSSEEPE
jgi:lysophospholipase L1-like esterase